MDASRPVLAIDLGGSKASAAAVTRGGELLSWLEQPTCQGGPEQGIAQLIRLAREALTASGLEASQVGGVGVSIAAALEPETDRVIWAPKLSGWQDVQLRPRLEGALEMPAFLEYDGHAAALGEWWLGSGKGCRSLVGLVIGTGVGGGMVLDGRLYRGNNRLAGAAGWLALTGDYDEQGAEEAAIGVLDARACGPGLVRYALGRRAESPESILWQAGGAEQLTPKHIFAAAREGDALARQVLDRLAGWLGLGIANIISLVNPQMVTLGGGVGSQCGELLPRIRQVARRWAQPFAAQGCQVNISRLGAQASLFGAAFSAFQRQQADSA